MFLEGEIDALLKITPVPELSAAFTPFKFIVSTVKAVQDSKEQLSTLAKALGQLLVTLDLGFSSSALIEASCVKPLNDLESLLEEVSIFVWAEKERGFLKSLFHAESCVASIKMFYHRIGTTASAFQISTMPSVQHFLDEHEKARSHDINTLNSRFSALEKSDSELERTLDINQNNMIAIRVSIQQRVARLHDFSHPEQKFYSHTLHYLRLKTGRFILEDWMISAFDVERGPEIGSGGFGTVFKGTWDRTEVAIKFLRNSAGVRADTEMLRKEINIWKDLRHPNILEFLGGNTLDDEPFVVMPLMPHTSRQFLEINTRFDPLYILRDVAFGLEYLHGQDPVICHGDLKGINVLVDARGHALLCDFGLTRIKENITTRTYVNGASAGATVVAGSRNWMAPELLKGAPLRRKSDIYAFGMTIYELYTNEVPMSSILQADFFDSVVKHVVRPPQPEDDECPFMTEDVWSLAERCWDASAKARPTAREIHDTIKTLMLGYNDEPFIDEKSSSAEDQVVAPPPPPPMSFPLVVPPTPPQQAQKKTRQSRAALRVHREDETAMESSATVVAATQAHVADDEMQQSIVETMARLEMSPCPSGYEFVRTDEGFKCKGGSHFVSYVELGMPVLSLN
ncbi:kinase-like domain-containing protein [Mycena galericulata]|nr:kinase-like domain-containing protein [Mycena galericulata]